MAKYTANVAFHQLQPYVRDAFKDKHANSITLSANTSLFRFAGGNEISPWWTETKYLLNFLLKAKASNIPMHQYVRRKAAVLRQWQNPMTSLVIYKLTQSVPAFEGIASPQGEADVYRNPQDIQRYKAKYTKSVFFEGGSGQVYIPLFQRDDNNETDEQKKQTRNAELNAEMMVLQSHYLAELVPPYTIMVYDNIDHIMQMAEYFF